jgi:hypothetical protein
MLHLALPLTVAADGTLASVTQDSPAEVSQSVALLLATRPGERRSVPGYGLPDPLFSGIDLDQVAAVIEEWEDRADPADIDLQVTGVEEYGVVYPAVPTADDTAVPDQPEGT